MAKKTRKLGPFMGLMTSVDPRDIAEGYAQDLCNVRIEDGKLRIRYAHSTLQSGGATAVYGFKHILGFNSTTGAELEEFLSVQTVNAVGTVAYSINPTTSAKTEVKNGVTRVTLNDSDWGMVAFNDKSYLFNLNNTPQLYQHAIGDATSLKAVSPPANPTTYMKSTQIYNWTGTAGGYARKDFASFDPTNAAHVTGTGKFLNAGSSLLNDNTVRCNFAGDPGEGHVHATVTLDFKTAQGANLDFSYNDIFQFGLTTVGFGLRSDTIQIEFINDDGSPITFGSTVDVVGTGLDQDVTYSSAVIRAQFNGKTRAEWDNVRYLKITCDVYHAPEGTHVWYLDIHPFIIGMVDCRQRLPQFGDSHSFAYSYYSSTTTWESGLTGASANTYLTVSNDKLLGYNPDPRLLGLGVWLKLFMAASSDSAVDKERIYVALGAPWYQVVEQDDATTTYLFRMTTEEVQALTITYTASHATLANVKCAAAFKGWMVWGMKGGYRNIQHSRIGLELSLANDKLDQVDDDDRGAFFSLADNYGDEPVCIFAAGDAVLIGGKYGWYAQVGPRPSQMTPPKSIPGALPPANQYAACLWRDAQGNPGVAFVAKQCEGAYFITVDQSFDGNQGFRVVELSDAIRPSIKLYMTDALVRIGHDDKLDAIWIVDTDDALVLRRPSEVDGRRQWERYNFVNESWKYLAFSSKRAKRVLGSTGDVTQVEYADDGTYYVTFKGSDTLCYWKSKDFEGPMRRVADVFYQPSFPAGGVNGPTVTITVGGSDFRPDSATTSITAPTPPGTTPLNNIRFGYKVQGRLLNYKINFNAYTSGLQLTNFLRQMDVDEWGPIGSKGMR